MRHAHLVLGALLVLLAAGAATADQMTLGPLQCGDDERVEGAGSCPQETAFTAGTVSTAYHLKVGGDSYGCNSEWATSLEFALDALPPNAVLVSATLVVRKTGYSDDSQGFFYLGAFAYPATGSPVAVERDGLTPETMLDVVYPPAANVDLSFDVTPAVRAVLDEGGARAGLLLAGVYSEAGYEDWISIGGAAYAVPPRLVVEYQATVGALTRSWSQVKGAYR
jgi:hypothetical protein